MAYAHGVKVREQKTSLATPIEGVAGVQVVFGTAPINLVKEPSKAVNKLVLCKSIIDAMTAFGYSSDYENYTLCQSMDANFRLYSNAPVVFCNVLDPAKHTADVEATECAVIKGQAVLKVEGVLINTVTVKAGDTPLVIDTDYIASFDDNGHVCISLTSDSAGNEANTLTVTATKLDPSKVTANDIIGGYDAVAGTETGLELIKRVFPMFDIPVGLIVAPGWSHIGSVAAVMQAKCNEINGAFKCECLIDIPAVTMKTTDGIIQDKEDLILTSPHAFSAYPMTNVTGKVMYYSAVLAAMYCSYDHENGDVPARKVSNIPLNVSGACLKDGTEVNFDQLEANELNAAGIITITRINGLRAWGNNSCAYPMNKDPKDRWITVRRMFTWLANTFITNFFEKVDDPTDFRLIESVVDDWNVFCSTLVANGNLAASSMEYNVDENPIENILNGKIVFHQRTAVFTPAEEIENVLEFDPNMLSQALNGGEE